MRKKMLILTAVALAGACSPQPYKVTNKVYRAEAKKWSGVVKAQPDNIPISAVAAPAWAGTVNFNLRKPNYVIIHHTAQNSCEQTLRTFTLERTQVSAHYVICRNGTVHHMLNDYLRAWHGGISKWGSITDINSSSIGIELDNNGFEPFDSLQIRSLLVVLDTLKRRYNIPAVNFIGHGDIAPRRKNDPSVQFPWNQLAEKGFGLWYDDTARIAVPDNFNHLQALRLIGYDLQDTTAAIQAFKRHFVPGDSMTAPASLTDGSRKILMSVMQKAL